MRTLINPCRVRRLIHEAISFNELDLTGLTVLTEAGSGNCVVTPILAALAGAERVHAITRDSTHGRAAQIAEYAYTFAEFCGVASRVDVVFEKNATVLGAADIVTNLGFVRPIDRATVAMMKPGAVVPLMYEAWELRPSDIDLDACRQQGIIVAGVNEESDGLDLFTFAGPICMQMLFEVGVEVFKSKVIVVSGDKFGPSIESYLSRAGARARLVKDLRGEDSREFLRDTDAIILADYGGDDVVIGPGGQISAAEVKSISPGVVVVLFAGLADMKDLDGAGILCNPRTTPAPRRMYRLFADLGPKPHIDLMAAGLKVGELVSKSSQANCSSVFRRLVQLL